VKLFRFAIIEWVLIDCNAEEFTFFGLSYANMEKRENGDLKPILDAQTLTLKEFAKDRFFERNGIQVRVFGEKQILPSEYQDAINTIEETTGYYESGKRVNLLLAFSGAKDLENAINKTII
jgi:undecaprenyl pyrophosphate synthase